MMPETKLERRVGAHRDAFLAVATPPRDLHDRILATMAGTRPRPRVSRFSVAVAVLAPLALLVAFLAVNPGGIPNPIHPQPHASPLVGGSPSPGVSPQPTDSPAIVVPGASPSAGASGGPPGRGSSGGPGSSGGGGASGGSGGTPPQGPPPRCGPGALQISTATDQPSYHLSQSVQITVRFHNPGSTCEIFADSVDPCMGPGARALDQNGTVWSSRGLCSGAPGSVGATSTIEVPAGGDVNKAYTWNEERCYPPAPDMTCGGPPVTGSVQVQGYLGFFAGQADYGNKVTITITA